MSVPLGDATAGTTPRRSSVFPQLSPNFLSADSTHTQLPKPTGTVLPTLHVQKMRLDHDSRRTKNPSPSVLVEGPPPQRVPVQMS